MNGLHWIGTYGLLLVYFSSHLIGLLMHFMILMYLLGLHAESEPLIDCRCWGNCFYLVRVSNCIQISYMYKSILIFYLMQSKKKGLLFLVPFLGFNSGYTQNCVIFMRLKRFNPQIIQFSL